MPEHCPYDTINEIDLPEVAVEEPGKLQLSFNRKVCPKSGVHSYVVGANAIKRTPGELEFYSRIPNSFALPEIVTCPGKTNLCETVCYKGGLTYPDINAMLMRNLELLKKHGSVEAMTKLLSDMMNDYIEIAIKLGIPQNERFFRIHWSGDFFSEDYAQAWRNVILEHPEIKFVAFTRSFITDKCDVNVLPILAGLENLELFLSVDRDNAKYATEALKNAPDVRVAYLVEHLKEAEELETLIRIMGRQACHVLACPEGILKPDGKPKIPLISEKGGACAVCKYCIKAAFKSMNLIRDVVFVETDLEYDPKGLRLALDPTPRAKRQYKPSDRKNGKKRRIEEQTKPLFDKTNLFN
jgi:hypothetical protein